MERYRKSTNNIYFRMKFYNSGFTQHAQYEPKLDKVRQKLVTSDNQTLLTENPYVIDSINSLNMSQSSRNLMNQTSERLPQHKAHIQQRFIDNMDRRDTVDLQNWFNQ